MRGLAFLVSLFLATVALAQKGEPHLGIFSNRAEGFGVVSVIVHKDGLGFFYVGAAGRVAAWKFDRAAANLTLALLDPEAEKEQVVELRFDAATRSYEQIEAGQAPTRTPPYALRFLPDEIPESVVAGLKAYPAHYKEAKAQAQARREQQKRRDEQWKKDTPEYERLLAQIRADPRSVLGKPAYYMGADTPEARAFRDSLKNTEFAYPEAVLVSLLEQLPENNHWTRVLIFARPELQAETLRRYYPKALEWADKLNHGILANIATHPNTPLELVRDLAGRTDIAYGAVRPAQERLQRLEGEKKTP